MSKKPRIQTAMHRPALVRRRFRHDNPTCLDLFSGFGGMTQGAEDAGFLAITAANHKAYKIEIHEANHPHVEHWIADLVDEDSPAYHSVRDLPYADLLIAGVSCKNHTQSNSKRAYATGATIFDFDDENYEAAVTKSERDRATANCVLHYAEQHHPKMILVECTTELTAWGDALPNKPKIGDGTTFRWWLRQFGKLGYRHRVLYLNSRFFDVDQSRDRIYIAFWDEKIPTPDLEHRPETWCWSCDKVVEARWTWKTGVPPSGSVRYGVQYNYRCPSCRNEVIPPSGYSLRSLDLSDLGTKIGERDKPLAPATMARAERCRQRFAEFPAVVLPFTRRGNRSDGRHPWQPLATQTGQQEAAVLSTAAIMGAAGNTFERPGSVCRTRGADEPLWSQTGTNGTGVLAPPVAVAVDNFQGAPRGVDEPLATQPGSETMALLSSGVLPFRKNTVPTVHAEAMPTVTSEQIPGLLTAAGTIKNNGAIGEAKYRAHPVTDPLGTLTSDPQQSLLFSGWFKNNGSTGTETAAHPVTDALGTLTGRDTTAVLMAEWRERLADLKLEDCYFRMMREHEIGRGCGFDVDFGDYKGTFKVWGSASDQVDGFGNAVSPPVSSWICRRLRAVYHGEAAA